MAAAVGTAGTTGGTMLMFEEWLKKVLKDGTLKADPGGEDIMATLKADLEDAWGKLSGSLTRQESYEIRNLCDKESWGGNAVEGQYKKILCQAILEIRYFMSGVETRRKDGVQEDEVTVEDLTDEEERRRCVVGAAALSTIYDDHCKLKDVIGVMEKNITSAVDTTLGDHLSKKNRSLQDQLDKCKRITLEELILGRAVLRDTIKQWRVDRRNERKGWRVGGTLWDDWKRVCPDGKPNANAEQMQKAQKEAKEANKSSLASSVKVGTATTAPTAGEPTMADILSNDDLTLELATIEKALEGVIKGDTVDPTELVKAMEKIKEASKEKA
ncbi:SICAvar, type I (fragment), partial [Plasmodium knowlesi strain H]